MRNVESELSGVNFFPLTSRGYLRACFHTKPINMIGRTQKSKKFILISEPLINGTMRDDVKGDGFVVDLLGA